MSDAIDATQSVLDRRLILLLSLIAAVTVGNLYLAQPLLAELADAFAQSPARVGIVVTLAQVGYGAGVLLIVPLGDMRDRRQLILILHGAVTCGLFVAASAPSLLVLAIASFVIGCFTVIPQIIMPYAASLAPDDRRASVIGTVQSGLLIGILLARTVSGAIATASNWRVVFIVAAGATVVLAAIVATRFPKQPVASTLRYRQVLVAMLRLIIDQPVFRRVSLSGAANFAVFASFWTALPFLLRDAYGRGPATAGLFGIIGVVGALAASVGGRMTDRRGARFTQLLSLAITAASVGLLFLGGWSMPLLVIAVIVLDAGAQSNHISCQAEVFSLDATARSRINGMYMFIRFLGGAAGSALSASSYSYAGWHGYCVTAAVLALVAFVPYFVSRAPTAKSDTVAPSV